MPWLSPSHAMLRAAPLRDRCRAGRSAAWPAVPAAVCLALACVVLGAVPAAMAQTDVPQNWALTPSGLNAGDTFRLLFITSGQRKASDSNISTFNTFVQTSAAGGHTAIQSYSSGFRVVGCTGDTDARDNTSTTYTATDKGVPIYWLNGNKVADDYEDFYDGNWDDETNTKNQSGGGISVPSSNSARLATGCTHNGTEHSGQALGDTLVTTAALNNGSADNGPIGSLFATNSNAFSFSYYALSQVFRVPRNSPATGKPGLAGTRGDPTPVRVPARLTAKKGNIADADGLPAGTFPTGYTFQWVRVNADGTSNPTDITGATASSYTLSTADAGKKVRVRVSFTDRVGNDESLESDTYPAGTDTILAAAPCNAPTGPGGGATQVWTGTVSVGGSRGQFGYRGHGLLLGSLSDRHIMLTPGGDTLNIRGIYSIDDDFQFVLGRFESLPSDELRRLTLYHCDTAGLVLSDAVYTLVSSGNARGAYYRWNDVPENYRLTTHLALTRDFYLFRDAAAPTVTAATVNGTSLVITFNEDLDDTSVPAKAQFTVKKTPSGSTEADVALAASNAVAVSGRTVTLTLGAAVLSTDAVTVAYAKPSSNPLRDAAHNAVENITPRAVTNNSPANNAATGKPAISGTATVGETLTAATSGIMDADGLTGVSYTYQWIRVDADGTSNETNITSATSSTYTLVADDVGKKIKVRVSFSDDANNAESLTSDAYPAGMDTVMAATVQDTFLVSNLGQSVHDVATNLQTIDQAQGFTTGSNTGGYTLSSIEVKLYNSTGGTNASAISARVVRDSPTGTLVANLTTSDMPANNATSDVTFTAPANTTLNASTTYYVVLESSSRYAPRGTSSDSEDSGGASGWSIANDRHQRSASSTGAFTTQLNALMIRVKGSSGAADTTPPAVESATVDGTSLVITFSENLAAAASLANSAFAVKKTPQESSTASAVALSGSPTISASTVTLTLATAVLHDDTVTVSYTKPTSGTNNKLQDSDGNEVATFTDQAVTNTTTAPNSPATGKPGIAGGVRVSAVLTAAMGDLADTDGLPTTTFPTGYTFQWLRVDADGVSNETAIGTAATYTLTGADVGKKVKVQVRFTDNRGYAETLTSAAHPSGSDTILAAAACPAPPATLDNGATQIWTATLGVGRTTAGFAQFFGFGSHDGLGSLSDTTFMIGSAEYTISDLTVRAVAVSSTMQFVLAPALPAAEPRRLSLYVCANRLDLQDADTSDFMEFIFDEGILDLTTHVGTSRTVYLYHDVAGPTVTAATVNGTSLVITFSENLAAAASLANSAFAVKKTPQGSSTASAVALSGSPTISASTVTLTLATAVLHDDTVTVSYTKPTSGTNNKLQDSNGNQVATFTDEPVTNTTPARGRSIEESDGATPDTTARAVGAPFTASGLDSATTRWWLGGPALNFFTIDASTGQVRTKIGTYLNYEDHGPDKLRLDIHATDENGERFLEPDVPINLIDRAEPPTTAPSDVQVVNTTADTIDVSWEQRDENTDYLARPRQEGYTIAYRRSGATAWTARQVLTSWRIHSTTVPGLAANTAYEVRVAEHNADGNGPWSATQTATTAAAGEPPVPSTQGMQATLTSRLGSTHYGYSGPGSAVVVRFRLHDEPVRMSETLIKNTLFEVTGGTISFARSLGRHPQRLWEIGIRVHGDADVHVKLKPSTACTDAHAVCNAAGERVLGPLALRVLGPASAGTLKLRPPATPTPASTGQPSGVAIGDRGQVGKPDRFTARFAGLPRHHDGESAFTFELRFSEAPPDLSYRTVGGGLLEVSGASVTGARRLTQGDNGGWEVTVEPTGGGDISIRLPARACKETNAVCLDSAPLAKAISATVPGVPFTASFAEVPEEHEASPFTMEFHLSEAPGGLSYKTVRDNLFEVSGARIEKASRVEPGKNVKWRLRIAPSGFGDVTLRLKPTTDCAAGHAVCTADGRMLAGGVTATVAGPVTLSVADAQVDEAGDATLDFTVTLSRARTSATTVRYATGASGDTATAGADYTSTTGTLTFAAGETSKTVSVPVLDDAHDEGSETLTLTLSNVSPSRVKLAEASATGTIKNNDPLQRAWLARFGRTVGTHVTDAVGERLRGTPGQDSYLTIGGYRVPLGRQGARAGGPTGEPGADAPGLLSFPTPIGNPVSVTGAGTSQDAGSQRSPGSPSKSGTSVEDARGDKRARGEGDEESRALAAKLWGPLTSAEPAEPPGRLATLVRDVAQMVGVGLSGQAGAPASATGAAASAPIGWDPWLDGPATDPRLRQSQSLQLPDLRQVLLGSAFRLNLNAADAGTSTPHLTAWGRFAGTRFDGRDGDLTLDGDVFTGTVGVDGEWDRLLAGVAVAHSRGDGAFRMPGTDARGRGELEQTLTSLHPYLRYAVTDRLDVWGLLGYGWGELDMESATGTTIETDTTLVMGAFGSRGVLLMAEESGGIQLATRTDAMLTRTSADAAANSAATDADAHRLRMILEGSRAVTWADGRTFTPTVELGLRHDWGDAETGFGLEVGGRVQYADPTLGLTIEAAVRGLVAHEDGDYQEWGASGNLRLAPGSAGRGLSMTLAPTWGAATSGVEGLWSRQTTQGLAPQSTTRAPAGRLAADVGYGLPAPVGPGLLTPYVGTVLTDGADRTYRVGTRWQMPGLGATGVTLNLEGTRQEPTGPQPVNQGLRLQVEWGF